MSTLPGTCTAMVNSNEFEVMHLYNSYNESTGCNLQK